MTNVGEVNSSELEITQIEEEDTSIQKEESNVLKKAALVGSGCLALVAVAALGLYWHGKLGDVANTMGSAALEGAKLFGKTTIITIAAGLGVATVGAMILGGIVLVGMIAIDRISKKLEEHHVFDQVKEGIKELKKGSEMLDGFGETLESNDDKIEKKCVYSSEGVQADDDETKIPVFIQINVKDIIGEDISAKKIQKLLKASQMKEFADGRVKGLILNINSPGGNAQESHLIYRAIKEYKKKYKIPVYAFVGGTVCVSGGFYVACAADKIYASKTSLIGSVGVRSGTFFNYKERMEKKGVDAKTFAIGKGKDDLNPNRHWESEEGKNREDIMKFVYDTFLNVVVKNRPQLSKEKLIEEYGAGVFPAKEAKEYGYIDETKSYEKTIKDLAQAVDLDETQAYQVIQFKLKKKPSKNIFDLLTKLNANTADTVSPKPQVYYL
ncbi:MAG: putative signal peptide peptidase SppA [Chlamydiae bacterium]|nr:putative signal peptide peptidase SppA [Chlamydiota bacterium]